MSNNFRKANLMQFCVPLRSSIWQIFQKPSVNGTMLWKQAELSPFPVLQKTLQLRLYCFGKWCKDTALPFRIPTSYLERMRSVVKCFNQLGLKGLKSQLSNLASTWKTRKLVGLATPRVHLGFRTCSGQNNSGSSVNRNTLQKSMRLRRSKAFGTISQCFL